MRENTQTQRKKGLDTIRGIGITGIVLYHLFPSALPGGFLGVPLFFALSGYLMYVTSEHSWQNRDFHIISYYKRRIKKIIPPLFTMVMAVCCYLTLTQSCLLTGVRQEICSIFLGYENWWQIARNASYFSRLAGASPFTHLWFLAVELQFYLLWPLLFLLYKKACQHIGGRKMCFFFLLLALLSAGKMTALYTPGTDPSRVYYGTDTMAFPLLLGIFFAALKQQYPCLFHSVQRRRSGRMTHARWLSRYLLPGFFALVIGILFFTVDGQSPFLYQGGMFFISLLFAAMIGMLTEQEPVSGSRLTPSLLARLGKKSYGIYLWHYPVIILALI